MLDGLRGSTTVGDIRAAITVKCAYGSTMNIGSVGDTTIHSGSSSGVSIAEVNGDLQGSVGYNSLATVLRGTINKLTLKLSSSSEVRITATVEQGTITAGYNSSVALRRVTRTLSFTGDSSSDCTVNEGQLEKLALKLGYNSKFTHEGSAVSANLALNSSCKVSISNVHKRLHVKAGYNSHVHIANGEKAHAEIDTSSSCTVNFPAHIQSGSIKSAYNSEVRIHSVASDVQVVRNGGQVYTSH